MSKAFIISGGPGSGKSTLLDALQAKGYMCMPEAARNIIMEQLALQSSSLPWDNLEEFSKLVLKQMLASKDLIVNCESPSFTDRGIPDIMAYLKKGGENISPEYHQHVLNYPYHKKVFLLPPWQEIYEQDHIRRESFETAVEVYEALKHIYQDLNFELVELKKNSVAQRIETILEEIKNHNI